MSIAIHSSYLEKAILKHQWFQGHISFLGKAHLIEFIVFKSKYNNFSSLSLSSAIQSWNSLIFQSSDFFVAKNKGELWK
jgi:hypothetical protein